MLPIIIWLMAVISAGVFFRSALQKLNHPLAFAEAVRQYEIIPPNMVVWFAPLVSVLEMLAAVWILLPWTRDIGAALGALLQGIFLTAILMRMGRLLPLGCGCHQFFAPERISWRHAVRNFSFLLALIILGGMSHWT